MHTNDASQKPTTTNPSTPGSSLSAEQHQAVAAAAFDRLIAHLRAEDTVANIDLMILAGFCRNCLSTWYAEAAAEQGVSLSKDAARELIYGMPYSEWKANQPPATPEQLAAMQARKSGH